MNILEHYKKINSILELDQRQLIAVLGWYNLNILPTMPSITFSKFIKNNVYTDTNGKVIIGVAKADSLIDQYLNTPTKAICINHAFWGLTENEETECKWVVSNKN